MNSLRFALTGLLAVSAAVSFSQPKTGAQAEAVIQKIVAASRTLRFGGTRTVELRFGPDQAKHIEFVIKDGPRSRIEFPPEGTYRGQILVENEFERRHYFPDRNQLEIMPPRRDEMVARLVKMLRKSGKPEITVTDGPRIAGIETQVVEVGGKGNHPMLRLWIDPQTYLIVKREVYGREGKPMVVTEYTKIDYNRRFRSSDFRLRVAGAKEIRPRDTLAAMVAKGGFQNISLAPKDPFKLESCRIQRIGDISSLVQVYVNGDAKISLFQMRTQLDPQLLRQFGRGEFSVQTWQAGGSSFVLLGDLPEDKLREVAQRLSS